LVVDAVDFQEMIDVARRERPSDRIHYMAGSAETYFDAEAGYDLVLSSTSFSAIRHIFLAGEFDLSARGVQGDL
jgi:hypothetical protein